MRSLLDNASARQFLSRIITPIANALIRLRISADSVTVFGAFATVLCAATLIPNGRFLAASLLIGVLALSDLLDGTIARITNSVSQWGAFLDSTLDRVVDAAVLISIGTYFGVTGHSNPKALIATAIALVMGQMTSYIRARAEALDVQCKVGLAERAERTLVVWLALLVTGLGWNILAEAMYLLAIITTFTVLQRVLHVRKQLLT